ncbi:MAG: DUF881 domain-containing protein [Clostridiales bacterium]|nr:DUF881 domain-containing protein [Clostridiales bacterium]
MKIARNIALTMVCIILGIMLAWQYKSVNFYQATSSVQNKRTDELKEDLIKLQNQKTVLQDKLKELEAENQTYENEQAGDNLASSTIQKELEQVRIFGGLVNVKGKGIIVTLENNEYIQVQDTDILNIVNELRASGAQAISVNDERIVAMSEIRTAGRYIMVNGKQMVSPFVIKAISDPDKLERSLMLIGGVVESLEEIQLKVDVKRSDDLTIPKFVNDGTAIKTDLLTPVE